MTKEPIDTVSLSLLYHEEIVLITQTAFPNRLLIYRVLVSGFLDRRRTSAAKLEFRKECNICSPSKKPFDHHEFYGASGHSLFIRKGLMITRIIGLPTDGDIDLNPETLNGTLSAAYQNHLGSPSRRRVKGRGYSSESL